MAIRLYELAKELKVPNKIMIEKCKKLGLKITTHFNAITDEEALRIRTLLCSAVPPPPRPPKIKKPPEKPAAPPARSADQPRESGAPHAPASAQGKQDGLSSLSTPITKAEGAPGTERTDKVGAKDAPRGKGDWEEEPDAKKAGAKPPRGTGGGKPHKFESRFHHSEVGAWKGGRRDFRRGKQEDAPGRRFPFGAPPVPTTAQHVAAPKEIVDCEVTIPITVRTLSAAMGIKATALLAKLMKSVGLVNINSILSEEVAEEMALEFGKNLTIKKEKDLEEQIIVPKDAPEDLSPRYPVIAVMGHVDHGKTTLLDFIRKTKVAASEAGGITQHIGAYIVETSRGKVVFLDTPGHEAFTEMRSRGANVTDIVVLVIAADDGVMPQTAEAIAHARAAKVSIVVAITKIDKPNANVERVKQQLTQYELLPEEWGGDTLMVPVSGVTGQGVAQLLDALLLQAEVMELKANPNTLARGRVLEAHISEGRGVVATLLVQNGTLRRGDCLLCSHGYGNVRSMQNDKGETLDLAGPCTPVEVSGLSELPDAGDEFYVLDDIKFIQKIALERDRARRLKAMTQRPAVTLESLSSVIAAGKVKELPLILKADVLGSLEVLDGSLQKLSNAEVKVAIIHKGIGGINDSDVNLAEASNAIIIGLHVVADARTRQIAEFKGVEIRSYRVLFQVIDDVRKALEGLLEPEEKEVVTGHLVVRKIFRSSKVGNIAGCACTDGSVPRIANVRLIRDNVILWEGKLNSLRREKDDVREVQDGAECGCTLAGYEDLHEGDIIEAYRIDKIARTLST